MHRDRAIIKRPKLLVTGGRRPHSTGREKNLQTALDNSTMVLTRVVDTHRLTAIRNADVIYVFDLKRSRMLEGTTSASKERCYTNLVSQELTKEKV